MRSMFGCGPGLAQLGYDFSSLENVAQGHYVIDFEHGLELVEALLAKKPNDLHCYSEDTEILTEHGWKTFGEIDLNTKVAQYDKGEISFTVPEDIVWQQYEGKMIHIKNKVTDQLLTPNHRVLTVDPILNTQSVERADYYLKPTSVGTYYVPVAGIINNPSFTKLVEEECSKPGTYINFRKNDIMSIPYSGFVGCVSVPTGFVVVRRNNKIFISGNTLNAKKLGLTRDQAKSITYALLYGAAPPKIKKMLGISTEESEKLVNDFWDAVPALRDLRDKVTAFWKATDKDYIPGIDGRKLRVRQEHSLLNTLFQSAGALLVKWSVIRTAELLEEKGILGDPLLHTKEDKKVFQMIVYHDEVQYACHRDFLDVECFFDEELHNQYLKDMDKYKQLKKEWIAKGKQKSEKPEEPDNPFELQAKQWMKDNPTDSQYSDIGHLDNGLHYVTIPNIISKTILQAIKDTEKLHGVRVPLGMEWITGANWYQCH